METCLIFDVIKNLFSGFLNIIWSGRFTYMPIYLIYVCYVWQIIDKWKKKPCINILVHHEFIFEDEKAYWHSCDYGGIGVDVDGSLIYFV